MQSLKREEQAEFYRLSRKEALLTVADNLVKAAGNAFSNPFTPNVLLSHLLYSFHTYCTPVTPTVLLSHLLHSCHTYCTPFTPTVLLSHLLYSCHTYCTPVTPTVLLSHILYSFHTYCTFDVSNFFFICAKIRNFANFLYFEEYIIFKFLQKCKNDCRENSRKCQD